MLVRFPHGGFILVHIFRMAVRNLHAPMTFRIMSVQGVERNPFRHFFLFSVYGCKYAAAFDIYALSNLVLL